MTTNLPKYSLRIPRELLDKIRYIADENGRSTNKEIELMIKQKIKNYEELYGPIDIKLL